MFLLSVSISSFKMKRKSTQRIINDLLCRLSYLMSEQITSWNMFVSLLVRQYLTLTPLPTAGTPQHPDHWQLRSSDLTHTQILPLNLLKKKLLRPQMSVHESFKTNQMVLNHVIEIQWGSSLLWFIRLIRSVEYSGDQKFQWFHKKFKVWTIFSVFSQNVVFVYPQVRGHVSFSTIS